MIANSLLDNGEEVEHLEGVEVEEEQQVQTPADGHSQSVVSVSHNSHGRPHCFHHQQVHQHHFYQTSVLNKAQQMVGMAGMVDSNLLVDWELIVQEVKQDVAEVMVLIKGWQSNQGRYSRQRWSSWRRWHLRQRWHSRQRWHLR